MVEMFNEEVLLPLIRSLEQFKSRNSFCINNTFYTYLNLGQKISDIRQQIRKFPVQNGNVGIIANDDIHTYASIIACWLEGYAYVPLHPGFPKERGMEIIETAGLQLLLDSSEKAVFPAVQTIKTEKTRSQRTDLKPSPAKERNNAYILFTSGSTGKPKGVPISRNSLGSFMKAFNQCGINIDENDRCLQSFDLTFDVSVQSFLFPLLKGACIYTIPHSQIKYSYASALLEDHKLTFSIMTPSMVRFLRPYFDEIYLPDLKNNIFTAEASNVDLIDEWSSCAPNAEIYNFYGPTEATIYCTSYHYKRRSSNKHSNGILSIGKPLKGISILIVDERNVPVSVGQKGELCISGNQLTEGYLNNPQKNQSSFFRIRKDNENFRFYKTGDLCYMDEEGDIMYSGRIDQQVKIQGFRIELGEIEYHAKKFLNGRNAVAVPFEKQTGLQEIALIVEGKIENVDLFKKQLQSRLPFYMLPSKIISKDVFPVNRNGKLDRHKLKKELVI